MGLFLPQPLPPLLLRGGFVFCDLFVFLWFNFVLHNSFFDMPFDENFMESFGVCEHTLNANDLQTLALDIARKAVVNIEWGSRIDGVKWKPMGVLGKNNSKTVYKIWPDDETGFYMLVDGENWFKISRRVIKFVLEREGTDENNEIMPKMAGNWKNDPFDFLKIVGVGKVYYFSHEKPIFMAYQTINDYYASNNSRGNTFNLT